MKKKVIFIEIFLANDCFWAGKMSARPFSHENGRTDGIYLTFILSAMSRQHGGCHDCGMCF